MLVRSTSALWMILACGPPCLGDVTNQQLQQYREQFTQFVESQRNIPETSREPAYRQLEHVVRLETADISVQGHQLRWVPIRLRPLNDKEQRETVPTLKALLRRAGVPDHHVALGTFGIAWQPDAEAVFPRLLRHLTAEIERALVEDVAGAPALRHLDSLGPQGNVHVQYGSGWEGVDTTHVEIHVQLGPAALPAPPAIETAGRDEIELRAEVKEVVVEFRERVADKVREMPDAIAREYGGELDRFLETALTVTPDPGLDVPLLDKASYQQYSFRLRFSYDFRAVLESHWDERTVSLTRDPQDLNARVEPDRGIMVGNPASGGVGVFGVRGSAARANPRRTIDTIMWSERIFSNDAEPHYGRLRLERGELDDPQLVVETNGFSGRVNALAFSPDGRYLAAAADVVRIWDVETGAVAQTLRGQIEYGGTGYCTDVQFSPDGEFLLVSVDGFPESVRIYSTHDFEIVDVVGGHDGHVEQFCFSPQGDYLVTAGGDQVVHVWRWELRDTTPERPFHIAPINPTGSAVTASAAPPGVAHPTWAYRPDLRWVGSLRIEQPVEHLSFPFETNELLLLDASGVGSLIHVEEHRPNRPGLRDIVQQIDNGRPSPAARSHPFAMAFDLARGEAVIGGLTRQSRQTFRYWACSAASRASVSHRYFISAVANSPTGPLAASADALGDVKVWNRNTGEVRHEFTANAAPVYSVQFSRDGQQILFGREPYYGNQWRSNQYGPLTHRFDMRSMTLHTIGEQQPAAARLISSAGQLAVDVDNAGYFLLNRRSRRNGAVEASVPFRQATRPTPICYRFLQGNATGFANAIVAGFSNGKIVCYEPGQMRPQRTFVGHTDRIWSISESPDGRFLVSGSADGSLRIWNLEQFRAWGSLAIDMEPDGTVTYVYPNTPTSEAGLAAGDQIRAFGYASVGELTSSTAATGESTYKPGDRVQVEWLPQGGTDPVEREIELSSMGDLGEPLLNLYVAPDGIDWVMWTQNGYYDSSLDGDEYLGWYLNQGRGYAAKYLPVSLYREQYRRPQLIARVWSLGDLEQAQRAETIDPVTPTLPPVVEAIEPTPAWETAADTILVRARISAPDHTPLAGASVQVNGLGGGARNVTEQWFKGFEPSEVKSISEREWYVEREVPLRLGKNEISISAWNKDNVFSERGVVLVHSSRREEAASLLPDLYVVCVGVSEYDHSEINLKFAHRDAEQLESTFRNQEGRIFSSVQTRLLTNGDATKENLERALNWLAKTPSGDDIAVLFLSGHGVLDQDSSLYYFVTHDYDPDDMEFTCLEWSRVTSLVRRKKCHLVVMADTCHSGGLHEATAIGDPFYSLNKSQKGAIVLTSSTRLQLSFENSQRQLGNFTAAILDAMGDRATDHAPRDGKIGILELAIQIPERVKELSRDRQTARWGKPPHVDDFPIAQPSP